MYLVLLQECPYYEYNRWGSPHIALQIWLRKKLTGKLWIPNSVIGKPNCLCVCGRHAASHAAREKCPTYWCGSFVRYDVWQGKKITSSYFFCLWCFTKFSWQYLSISNITNFHSSTQNTNLLNQFWPALTIPALSSHFKSYQVILSHVKSWKVIPSHTKSRHVI